HPQPAADDLQDADHRRPGAIRKPSALPRVSSPGHLARVATLAAKLEAALVLGGVITGCSRHFNPGCPSLERRVGPSRRTCLLRCRGLVDIRPMGWRAAPRAWCRSTLPPPERRCSFYGGVRRGGRRKHDAGSRTWRRRLPTERSKGE